MTHTSPEFLAGPKQCRTLLHRFLLLRYELIRLLAMLASPPSHAHFPSYLFCKNVAGVRRRHCSAPRRLGVVRCYAGSNPCYPREPQGQLKPAALTPSILQTWLRHSLAPPPGTVQCFGRKKTAVAVAYCKPGRGLIKVNGVPIELIRPEMLRLKAFEPIMLAGRSRFKDIDMRIRVRGGGKTSQIYAIRQAMAKALVAYFQKYVDEASKKEVKDIFSRYDRTLLVADPRRCERKKFGGRGARARFQKSYR